MAMMTLKAMRLSLTSPPRLQRNEKTYHNDKKRGKRHRKRQCEDESKRERNKYMNRWKMKKQD